MKALVAYGSRYGTTQEVSEAIASELRAGGDEVVVAEASRHLPIEEFDLLVVGSGIYAGMFRRRVMRLLERIRNQDLADRLVVFACGPVEQEHFDDARGQLEAILDRAHARQVPHELFGGAMLPDRLPFWLRRVEPMDLRDWDAIRAWARQLHTLVPTPAR